MAREPTGMAGRLLARQRAERATQSEDATKPEEHVVVVTAPRIRPRARPSGPSEADRLNETSLALARGRQGPLAPGRGARPDRQPRPRGVCSTTGFPR